MLVVGIFLFSRYGEGKRILAIILIYIPGIVACAILYAVPVNKSTEGIYLFAIYLIALIGVARGLIYSLLASNIAGYTKKTVSSALFFSLYCVANIVCP